jgi:hypothetical protein
MADRLPPTRGLSFGGKVAVQTPILNAPILSQLSLSANQAVIGNVQGTVIGTVLGLTSGSTLLLINSASGAVQLVSGVLQVGPTPPTSIGSFNIQLMEVLDGAVNSPNITTISGAVIDIRPTINTAPSIPSTPMVGSPIMAIDAIWNNTVISLSYQWQSAGINAIGAGATTLTYTPVIGDLGNTLTITVTAANSGGAGIPSTSAPSATVMPASSDTLKISLQIAVCSLPLAA